MDSTKERKEFNYLENIDEGTFFRFKGNVYDLRECMRCNNQFPGWDGYYSESAFSGVLVKLVDAGEKVIVGQYFS